MRTFKVEAVWDPEARVFYSESDIFGLHIEAKTIESFEEIMRDLAPRLIEANHLSQEDIDTKPMRELVSTIVWQRPAIVAA